MRGLRERASPDNLRSGFLGEVARRSRDGGVVNLVVDNIFIKRLREANEHRSFCILSAVFVVPQKPPLCEAIRFAVA